MISIIIAAFGILVVFVIQVLMLRTKNSDVKAYFVSHIIGLAAVILAGASYVEFVYISNFPFFFVNIMLFLAWSFILLNIIQSFVSSLRINILRLMKENGGTISKESLNESYNDRKLIETRLVRLKKAGAIFEVNDVLYVSSFKLKVLAKIFSFLKKIMFNKTSEFQI
mgnify:CR=1 FL=1|tara:strand:- start:113 stop:616 length:504 start_codon:yes stop_codon:yes gene_type:complete